MGMAASQARYLGLTARKTNVEYEGQQINQQRTALANQSANFFNQLNTLNVPTPPSTQQFTKVQYTYNDGTNTQTISNATPLTTIDPNYNYSVTHYYEGKVFTGVESTTVNPQVKKTSAAGEFTAVGNSPLDHSNIVPNELTSTVPNVAYNTAAAKYTAVGNYNLSAFNASTDTADLAKIVAKYPASNLAAAATTDIYKYTDSTGSVNFACTADLATAYNGGLMPQNPLDTYVPGTAKQLNDITQIIADLPNSQFAKDYAADPSNIYTFMSGGNLYYACESDLEASYASNNNAIDNQVDMYKYNAVSLNEKQSQTENASIQIDSAGRFTSIKLASASATYDLTANSITDENAYNDAMNQYTYQNQMYEKSVQDINAKTEVIQQEDRTLELRLRQLDTEQKALSTEMDSVKKVIDKNIESTFKTFSS